MIWSKSSDSSSCLGLQKALKVPKGSPHGGSEDVSSSALRDGSFPETWGENKSRSSTDRSRSVRQEGPC